MPTVRPAVATDAAALAAFAEATFRATFAADNTAADMDQHCRTSYGADQQGAEIADPTWCTLLSEHDGQLVGYAQLRFGAADVVWLGVWERNPRAIAFYRRSGFVEVGEHVFQLGSDPQRDVIMAKALGSRAPR